MHTEDCEYINNLEPESDKTSVIFEIYKIKETKQCQHRYPEG